jgi:hypothetical protein
MAHPLHTYIISVYLLKHDMLITNDQNMSCSKNLKTIFSMHLQELKSFKN